MKDKKVIYPCAVCGEIKPEKFKIYFDGYVKLYQCKRCFFVAQYPGPGINTIIKEYEDIYSLDFLKSGKDFMYPERSKVFNDIAQRIKNIKGTNVKILDVGCGDGHFLYHAGKLGFECYGVEPSKVLADYASKKNNCNVIQANYNKTIFPENSFDVISFIQVIEHLEDPISVLEIAKYHLREDGLLVIEVPSLHAPHFLAYKFSKIKKFVKPPHGIIYSHFGYYCPSSLNYLTSICGFEKLSLITGRWQVKYTGILKFIALITDPIFNALKIGGILYFGIKK